MHGTKPTTRVFWWLLTLGLVLAPAAVLAQVDIPVEIHETAGHPLADHPVFVAVPIPFRALQGTEGLMVVDGSDQAVPAQFTVLKRWWERGGSLREVGVAFKATVPASGRATYHLRAGANPAPGTPVTVSETAAAISVDNGRVSFSISKTAANFLDGASVSGQTVIDNAATDGSYHVNRFGNTYLDAAGCAPAPTVFEVEQAGPVRARIRIERPSHIVSDASDPCHALFPGDKDPVPGFVTWFDVYHDDDRVRVHHLTMNSGITAYRDGREGDGLYGWPYFFEETGIVLRAALSAPTLSVGHDGGVFTTVADLRAVQETPATFTIPGGPAATTCSFADLADATGLGFAVMDPYCHETQPNAWDFDAAAGTLAVVTAPDGCLTCAGMADDATLTTSGLYIIHDMSAQEKIFDLVFHQAALTEAELRRRFDLARHPPTGVTTPATYRRTGAATDLYGMLPVIGEVAHTPDLALDGFDEHMQFWGVDMGRYSSCGTGGIATAGMGYLVERPPNLNVDAVHVYDQTKRKQYVPAYFSGVTTITPYRALQIGPDILFAADIEGHAATEFSTSGYCTSEPIRAHNYPANGYDKYVPGKPFPGDFGSGSSPSPRDNPHLWMQPLYDLPTDNPVAHHFRRRYEHYLQGYGAQLYHDMLAGEHSDYQSEGDSFPSAAVRGMGHSLIALSDAYADSGDPDSLAALELIVDAQAMMQAVDGTLRDNSISFQDGFNIHGLLNAMMHVGPEHALFGKAWTVIFGTGGQAGELDAVIAGKAGYYAEPGCADCESSGTSTTILDPFAVAAYLLAHQMDPETGAKDPARAQQVIAFLVDFLDGNLGAQPYFIDQPWRTAHTWRGESYGRMIPLIAQWETLSPDQWPDTLDHDPLDSPDDLAPAQPLNLVVE